MPIRRGIEIPPGSERECGVRARVRPGTWETPSSPRCISAGGATGNQMSRLTGAGASQRGSERWRRPRHHRAKETKRGGKGDGESERLSTTGEAGEPTRGTPRREEGRRDTELLGGKTTEPLTSDTVSTRLQRIAELAREDPEAGLSELGSPH